jgi:WD40 repeat protein
MHSRKEPRNSSRPIDSLSDVACDSNMNGRPEVLGTADLKRNTVGRRAFLGGVVASGAAVVFPVVSGCGGGTMNSQRERQTTSNAKCVFTWTNAHTASVSVVTTNDDGSLALTHASGEDLKAWDVKNGMLMWSSSMPAASGAKWGPAAVVGVKSETSLVVFDGMSGVVLFTVNHSAAVSDFAFSDDGTLGVSCSGGMLYRWSQKTGEILQTVSSQVAARSVDISPDGTIVVVCGSGGLSRFPLVEGVLGVEQDRSDLVVSSSETCELVRFADSGRLLVLLTAGSGMDFAWLIQIPGWQLTPFYKNAPDAATASFARSSSLWAGLDVVGAGSVTVSSFDDTSYYQRLNRLDSKATCDAIAANGSLLLSGHADGRVFAWTPKGGLVTTLGDIDNEKNVSCAAPGPTEGCECTCNTVCSCDAECTCEWVCTCNQVCTCDVECHGDCGCSECVCMAV